MELSALGLLILLSHVSPYLSSSNNLDLYHRHKRHTDPKRLFISLHASLNLKSPGFPKCCQPFTFIIEYGGREGTGFIRLLFDDLDLPKASTLQIHDGPNSTSPAFPEQPRYYEGSWTRPVIAATSKYVFLKFTPGPTKGKTYVGFKASYWTVQNKPSAWTLDKHFTICPHLGDPMDGGQVNLQTLKISDNIKYSFDCVWQIKSPQKKGTFGVYARVVSMNLEHGRAEIRDDIHSDADELVIFSDVEASSEAKLASLNQPRMGYTSQRGLYIRVAKPIDKGHFNFVYGVFQETGLSVMSCEFIFQDKELPGFKCAEINWCIPKQHLCNSVPNCPQGSDEDASLCKKLKPDTAGNANEIPEKPTPPTGECSYDQQKCPDNTCVAKYYGKCADSGACEGDSEKLCVTGQCVQKYQRCPEESCPAYRKNSCDSGWICYYDTDKCDGYPDCQDGQDEKFCTKEGFKWWYLLFLIIFPIGLIILLIRFCIRKCRNNKYKRRYENGQISFFGTTMEPVMTPVRGNGSMSVPSYSSRCHSPTSDHSNVTYQPITCTSYHPYSNQNGTAGFLEHLRRNSDQYRKEIEQYRREHEKLQDGKSKRSSNMDELLRGDPHHHHHHHHRCCNHVDHHHDNLTPMHSSTSGRGNHSAHSHHHHHHHNHHHSTSSHNLQRDGSRRQSRASMCSSHSNVTSELPVGSNGTGTSSHQSMHSSEPSRTSGMPDEDKELQVLRETCCQVVPHGHSGHGSGGHGHSHGHHHRSSSHHHDSGMLGPSAVVCPDDTCHLTVFSSPRGSRRGSREFLQHPEIHENHIGHSRNSLQVESRNKEEDQHSIYSLSASDTDDDEEESIYTPRTSRAHSMRSRRSRTSTSMLSARSGRTDRSKSFCVSSVCGSEYSHPSQKRKGTVSDLSIPVPNGHHHGPMSPSRSPSTRTSPTHMRCRSPSLLDPVFPSPAPPPYSETLFKERFHLSTESLPDKSKDEEHHHDAVPDLFGRKQHAVDGSSGAPGGPETMPMTIAPSGGGRRGKRGGKAKTGLSAMLLGVNTMYDTSSSSYEDDDDE